MAMPRIPKPQAGGSDIRARQAAAKPARIAARAARNPLKAALRAPVAAVSRAVKGTGASSDEGQEGAAASTGSRSASALRRGARGIGGAAAGLGARAAKGTARLGGKVAKKAVKKAAKQAAKGIAKLLSNPYGWAVLVAAALFALIVAVTVGNALLQFGSSFSLANTEVAGDAMTAGTTGTHIAAQAPGDDAAAALPVAADNSGQIPEGHRLSILPTYPAGEVLVEWAGGQEHLTDGREILYSALPDRSNLVDVVEWMLPQVAAPYPVLVASPPGVTVSEQAWPTDASEIHQVVTCTWPEGDWAAPPPYEAPDGEPVVPSDVTISGPWGHQQQHVCHLFAAADAMWSAWGKAFGDLAYVTDAIGQPQGIRPDAVLRSLDVDGTADFLGQFETLLRTSGDSASRMAEWLTFASAISGDHAPVSGQYDCGLAGWASSFDWSTAGVYADSGGVLQPDEGISLPSSFFADVPDGHLLMPWPCPRPVIAAVAAASKGMWMPVVWSRDDGGFGPGKALAGGLSSATATDLEAIGIGSGLASRLASGPADAAAAHKDLVNALPSQFGDEWLSSTGAWSAQAISPSGDLVSWCSPETLWVSGDGTQRQVASEPDVWPKAMLGAAFQDDIASVTGAASDASGLLASVERFEDETRSEIVGLRDRRVAEALAASGVDPTDSNAVAAVVAQAEAEAATEVAALQDLLSKASAVKPELREIVAYWQHEAEQASSRSAMWPAGWAWQFECEHSSFDEVIGALAARFSGSDLPHGANPIRALHTFDGRGSGLARAVDHGAAAQSPLEDALRAASHHGLLPALPAGRNGERMVSASCSESDWRARECSMARRRAGAQIVLALPDAWIAPRLPLRCPSVFPVSTMLLEELGTAANSWEDAADAGMVSTARFTSFHPCLLPDLEALTWLVKEAGMDLGGHGFRPWEVSDELAAQTHLAAAGGASRHNYGLAVDMFWAPPSCWPPPNGWDDDCPPESWVDEPERKTCGMEARNGANGGYLEFATPLHNDDELASLPHMHDAYWCFRFIDWATFHLSDTETRLSGAAAAAEHGRYQPIGLMPLTHEIWHWSYDGR